MRRCESPDETYFPAIKRCIKFESKDVEGACPVNQVVLDGPNNRGLCACNEADSTIMNRQDHQCYEQFTQVKHELINSLPNFIQIKTIYIPRALVKEKISGGS